MSYAVLFPGQGSQHEDMLPWLESHADSQAVVAAIVRRLGADWRERLADRGWRHRNAVAQVLVTGTALAAWAALAPLLPGPPAIVAGYSVGELAACAGAGAFDPECALQLASERAAAMDRAAEGTATALLSVSGLGEPAVAAACADLKIECAIRIAATHVIVAGEEAVLRQAQRRLENRGAVCRPLAIGVASHSSWMREATPVFAQSLQSVALRAPRCPVALDCNGCATRDPETIRSGLARQLDSTVQWSACMEAIAERRVACVIEVGAGNALSNMWNVQHPQIPARAVEDFRDVAAIAAWVRRSST